MKKDARFGTFSCSLLRSLSCFALIVCPISEDGNPRVFLSFTKGYPRSCVLALPGGFPDGYALLWQTAEAWILFRISSRGFRIGPFWKGHDPLHRWSCGRFPVR